MNTPSPRKFTGRVIHARCRPDLIAVPTRHRHDTAVVVKDPVAMKYHRLRPDEYYLLQRLDGHATLETLCDDYSAAFPPWKVTPAELNALLFRFHRSGLTIADVAGQGDRLNERRVREARSRWMQRLSSLLFIRFPGVDPKPLLRRVYRFARWMFHPVSIAAACGVVGVASCAFILGRERFATEFPSIQSWLRADALVLLAVVIACTKILHELGHALVCKHFGGECHEIGPMLLVFTPALYCDASDSWMFPSRFARASVGLAGIGTEVLLAALATLVWSATAPGLTHAIAMNVMLVCGVSTILFNANPLLRYDGYYVLSDLVDVPNLAEKARRVLADLSNRVFFGIDAGRDETIGYLATFWLCVYAIAAFIYRWALTLTILWFVTIMLRPVGLESVGRLLAVVAGTAMLVAWFRPIAKFLRHPGRRRQVRMKRLGWTAGLGLLAGVILFIPLPATLSVDGRIKPRDETSVFVATTGTLRTLHVAIGDRVSAGDQLATLENPEIELQALQAKGRYETQVGVVASLRDAAIGDPAASKDLPAQESLLNDLRDQWETWRGRVEALDIMAPTAGVVLPPPFQTADPQDQLSMRLVTWSGDLTDPRNRDCTLMTGTELLSIVPDASRHDVEIILPQSDVDALAVGAAAKLVATQRPGVILHGTVVDISRDRWTDEQDRSRRDDPVAARGEAPPETSYVVRVELLDRDQAPELLAESSVTGQLRVQPSSLAERLLRALQSLIRFR